MLICSSYLFTRLQHPLAIGLTLIFQTLLICLTSAPSSGFTWISYILFLIFLGATLVLFIYVASLASNEVFNISYVLGFVLISPILIALPLLLKEELINPLKPTGELSSISALEIVDDPTFRLRIIYGPSTSFLTSFVILYLLLTLIVIVKLRASFTGPLRLS